ncbi:MAG: AAA family ATPase, partial [Candidatus Aminicenantes bacterium]|nr:AAA family ATPase [Candidatus Aminicenantes bacterium]
DCFEQKVKAGDFIEVGELKGATYFSTEQNIRIENGIYEKAAVVKKQENYVPGFAYTKVNKYLDRSTLTTGQKEAVLFMTGSRCRVRAVQAAPGTGVPFMLNFARDFYEQEGDYKVVALTPTKKAADNLKEKAGIEDAATLHSYFIQLQKETGTWEAGGDPLDLRKANFAGLTPGSNREIWFVDKAGLVDNVAMNKLMEASALKKAEVVLIGDTKQFQPVGAGRPFANMIGNGKIGYIELDEIVRQTEVWQVFDSAKLSPAQRDKILQQASQNNAVVSFFKSRPCDFIDAGQLENIQVQPGIDVEVFKDSSLKQAIESVLDRDIAAGLETLKSRIQEIRDDDLRLEKIAGTYTSLSPAERKQTHVITGTNRDRVRINDFIRQNLKTMGEIGAGEVFDVRDSRGKKQQREFAPGDKIIFLENYDKISGHDVTKGDTGTVRKIEIKEKENNPPDRFIVVETKGKSVVIDPAEYNYLDHSQCSTSYKVMSAGDKKRALAHFDSKQYNVNNSNDLLVKLSAAGQEITIFCDDAKSLYDSVKREQDKVSINDFPPENFKKHQEPELSKEEAEKAARYKLLAKVAGKFEYKNAAFTKADFVFGSMDVYSDLRREDEAAAEISAGDLAAYFKEKVDSGEFLEVGSIGEDAYFATEENINVENGIYEKAASAKDNITGFEENKVRRYAENTTLTTGQKDVLVFTATSKDRVRAIQGNPGVGKSFMLNIAKNFYEDENYKVIALAPSNKAVTNLKERAGFEDAATIHAYLMKLQKQSSTWATGRDARDLRFANLNEITPGNYKEVWFVDEASLIDNHAMDGLLEAAEKKNAEMVLIGDKNQLQPVGAGKPFSVLLKEGRIQHSELKDILRQKAHWTVYDAGKLSKTDKEEIVKQAKLLENNAAVTFVKTGAAIDTTEEQNPVTYRVETYKTGAGMEVEIHKDSALKEAVKDAVDHNIAASLNKLGSRVTGIENNIERFRVIASRYAELPAQVRNEAVIITATNRDRTAINDFVR